MRENRKIRRILLILGLCLLLGLLLPGRAQAADEVALSLGYQFGGVAGDDGVLYVWGTNYYGQLGNGEGGDESGATYAPQTVSLSGKVVGFSAGYQSAVALLSDGTVWAWGENKPVQIAGYSQKALYSPVKITLSGTPVKVRAGYDCMGALMSDGSLYLWGNNDYGQLGNGTTESSTTPVKVSLSGKVTDFDLQSDHVVALLEDGSVWTWGSNVYGQLGNASQTLAGTTGNATPAKVTLPAKATSVAAGTTQTAAVLSDGSVYIWGGARYLSAFDDGGYFLYCGESGARDTLEAVYTPGKLDLSGTVTEVALGSHHGAAVTSDGGLYTWGKNDRLQLGYNTASSVSATPKKVSLSGKVAAVSLMDTSTAVVLEDGTLWGWGNNEVANLGLTDSELSILPTKIMTGLIHPAATSVSLSKSSASLTVGSTLSLTATVSPSTAIQNVTWSSSNTSVATVDQNGKVSAIAKGSAVITAKTSNGKTAICSVSVTLPSVKSISLSAANVLLAVGDSHTVSATLTPSGTGHTVLYSSSDSRIATVGSNTGKITGVKEGTCTITATVKDQTSVKTSITVTVVNLQPVYRLYLPKTGEHLYTTDANEKQTLYEKYGWGYEGIGWYATSSGTAVYRLYHPTLQNHLYTTDTNEVKVLTTKYGWQKDNGGKPLYYSSGSVPIYRVYNKALNGMHHLTTDTNEYATLPKYGWTQEGIKIWAYKIGSPITTTYYKKS